MTLVSECTDVREAHTKPISASTRMKKWGHDRCESKRNDVCLLTYFEICIPFARMVCPGASNTMLDPSEQTCWSKRRSRRVDRLKMLERILEVTAVVAAVAVLECCRHGNVTAMEKQLHVEPTHN